MSHAELVLWAKADLALRARHARRDFCAYLELTGRDNYRRPMRQAWLHRTWQGHILWCWSHGLHPVIIAPWGSGKTVQLAVEYPVWMLGRMPVLRVSLISNVEPNAKKRVAQCSWCIGRRQTTRMVFPELAIQPGPHSKFSFSVVGGGGTVDPSFSAWGAFGSGTGSRVDLLLLDDVVDQGNAILQPAKRPQLIEQVDAVWFSRLEPICSECGGTGVAGGLEAFLLGGRGAGGAWVSAAGGPGGAGLHATGGREGALGGDPCPNCYGTGGGRSVSIGTLWHTEDLWHGRMVTPGFCVLLQRVNLAKSGYECEVYGVPAGETYPGLSELIAMGSPSSNQDQLAEMFARDMQGKARLDEQRRVA